MELEEAKSYLETVIKVNNSVIKQARKNGDINTIELTADLDCQSIAIETVLHALKNKQKDIENYEQMYDEDEKEIYKLYKKICDLEFELENKDKQIISLKKIIDEEM